MTYSELFARTELLVGKEAMQNISKAKVILFGVGGVGSWCAEGLIRSGVMNLTLVDADCVATANINRQLPATTETIGMPKVDVLQQRLIEISPEANIQAIKKTYSVETSASFKLNEYDYVIDAIDSLTHKTHLITTALDSEATLFSSMGAALKIDPQQIRVAEFRKVKGCKLAAALRQRMKKSGFPGKPFLCVYSEERLTNKGMEAISYANEKSSFRKAQVNGTMVQVTAVFGFTLSGLVIQDIVMRSKI